MSTLKKWCLEFRYHGDTAFERAPGNQTSPATFKQYLIEEYYATGISCFKLGVKYQIDVDFLFNASNLWYNILYI